MMTTEQAIRDVRNMTGEDPDKYLEVSDEVIGALVRNAAGGPRYMQEVCNAR